ncbi:MAG: hypothetical protein ACOC3S_03325 [Bacteroidota bacterium]
MVWDKNNYPDSMKNLAPEIREKAIEIANQLIRKKNLEESIAIPTAISRAREWKAKRK